MKNFLSLRKKLIADVYGKFKTNRLGKNYSKIKALICLELGSVFAFFFIKLNIKPNLITFIYIILILAATFLFGTGKENLIYIGVLIFFFKNSLDLIDGFIARITKQTSALGHKLDTWAGYISLICFQLALGLYVYSRSLNVHYLYFTLLIVTLSAIDFKKHYLSISNRKKIHNFKKPSSKKNENIILSIFFKIFSTLDYDARSRYTDLVLLVIIIETFKNELMLSPIIIYVWVLTNLGKFLYKAFKTYNLE